MFLLLNHAFQTWTQTGTNHPLDWPFILSGLEGRRNVCLMVDNRFSDECLDLVVVFRYVLLAWEIKFSV